MKLEVTLRWLARCLSIALVALVIILAIGEGLPPLFGFSVEVIESWLLVLAVVGLLAAWRCEFWGAIASLVGLVGFYFTNFAASGFQRLPRYWLIPTLTVIPALFLMAWWRHRKTHQGQQAPHGA